MTLTPMSDFRKLPDKKQCSNKQGRDDLSGLEHLRDGPGRRRLPLWLMLPLRQLPNPPLDFLREVEVGHLVSAIRASNVQADYSATLHNLVCHGQGQRIAGVLRQPLSCLISKSRPPVLHSLLPYGESGDRSQSVSARAAHPKNDPRPR